MAKRKRYIKLFDPELVGVSIRQAFVKLKPALMIKNPVNPDISLWCGALERMNNAGIKKLAAIHRGFSSYEKTAFRNEPMWELAIQLKTLCPELPIINDPSHICGNRELIQYISQKALDLDMQGLMIESHIDPSVAWTDAKQQVTPYAFVLQQNEKGDCASNNILILY